MKNEEFELLFSSFFELSLPVFFVVPGRLELPTSTLSVWRSNQLSYRTMVGRYRLSQARGIPFGFLARLLFSLLYLKTEFVSTRRFLEKTPYLFFLFWLCCRYFIRCTIEKASPERRCSSRTFRYGYLVTT